jgi:hypothetical protein
MVRRILYALLSLAPIVILLALRRGSSIDVEFVLAATALIPLAWLIGEATEHAASTRGRASAASSTPPSATPRS